MKTPRSKDLSKRLGSALVMTLVIIVLITVVTVGYLASVMLETKTAGAGLDQERAYGIAMIGVHEAMSRVRDALGPWDDPYKNFATNAPPFYWSLSPGRITRWPYSSASPTNFALFSESSGTNLVNLNRALADGSYPIIGGTTPPDVSVKWVNVVRDPSKAVGADNAIIGRYAFWVDDEGAKINVNTADGTEKYTTNSLGIGSPSEVSLEVLFGGADGKIPSQEIVQIARTRSFHSPREILGATNVTSDVYTNNVFALTTYSRSPDLNIFGQPKMALTPILGGPGHDATNMVINGITLRPVQEIYPSPSQLPVCKVPNPVSGILETSSWPLAFRAEQGRFTLGRGNGFDQGYWFYTWEGYCYNNGQMLANYLAGTNSAGQPLRWPVFPGSSPSGFSGKYTPRQIDNIVAQILSLGSKAICADYPYPSSTDYPGNNVTPSRDDQHLDRMYEQEGCRYNVAPFMFPGWLSRQWVIGMGRAPKVNRILLELTAFGSQGTIDQPGYIPPRALVDIWIESWLPAAFLGGKAVITPQGTGRFFGPRLYYGALNASDMYTDTSVIPFTPPLLKKPDGSNSYWANQVLRSNQGIDFAANPYNLDDPDQTSAAVYHDPYARVPGSPPAVYMGTGGMVDRSGTLATLASGLVSPLAMSFMQENAAGKEWYPGEFRCVRSRYGSLYPLPMKITADGSNLEISGGIAVRSQIFPGWFSDPDPVPLEAVRGEITGSIGELLTGGDWPGDRWSDPTGPGGPGVNLRDRHIASVIPVNNVSIPVPPKDQTTGNVRYFFARTRDPLVNKFPGDWKLLSVVSDTPPSTTMRWNDALPNQFSTYDETDINFRSELDDPDSIWMPQADCALSRKDDLASQTLIPRSARMPNVGYLQYVRTGVIPDDETQSYEDQHGTPFRLLSFAPSTDTANQKTTLGTSAAYPDWALLDLLYVPSTLTPFGGSYHSSANLISYGTFGGATSGRINPNGSVIYTTNANVPQANVSRTLAMQAIFNGVKVGQQISGTGVNAGWTGGTTVDAVELAKAVEKYVRTTENGALRMPSEICNIPAIASLRASKNPTRNDLVRQVVGSLTTQGNVFSVWTVGQVVQKKQGSADYGKFQPGDNVLAEVRLRFVVERYLDPGADGIYGNSANSGPDGVVGSYDDPKNDVNHPFQPRYLYRVVSSEEIR